MFDPDRLAPHAPFLQTEGIPPLASNASLMPQFTLMNTPKLLLLILDGFGIRDAQDHNAIATAHAPTWHNLWATKPHTLLAASGEAVGLPAGQMGNSEVGHMTIGAGRVIYQDLTRIDRAIAAGELQQNTVLQNALHFAKAADKTVHLLGLLSPGGVHSHEQHLYALLQQCQQHGLSKVCIHAFLDGRDVPPKSAEASLTALEKVCQAMDCGHIASLCGRYYAMDRDQRWERTEQAYALLTEGTAPYQAASALAGLQAAYERNESDEFVRPTLIGSGHPIEAGDVVIFWNYRSDRARQLSRAFLSQDFTGFHRPTPPHLGAFVSLTQYAEDIPSQVIFPPQGIHHTLGECLAEQGIHQFRIAETEKYAHVTFFFNGGRETVFDLEQRCLIPSPKVATYDQQPAMSAGEISQALIAALQQQRFGFLVSNYANPDMVGHTGNFDAARASIETLDRCLKDVIDAAQANGYEVIITADHGNAECMYDETHHQPHTAHTTEPVPFVYIGRAVRTIKAHGSLADVAPTILALMGLAIPPEMTGQVLVDVEPLA